MAVDDVCPSVNHPTSTSILPSVNDNERIKSYCESQQRLVSINGAINAGYASDDEASEFEVEPQDSGRTRSSTRRAQQVNQQGKDNNNSNNSANPVNDTSDNDPTGRKRKRKTGGGSDGDSDSDGQDRRRSRLKSTSNGKSEKSPVCCCPTNVMRCIGVLPSLPIATFFHDSDDSDSSIADDFSHTVLPMVKRGKTESD